MIILKEQAEAQIIKFIPREMSADTILLKNEGSGIETTIIASFNITDYYLQTNTVLDLKENNFYNLTILNGADIVYKDKVFCTNQPLDTYTVNKNQYVSNDTNNEFIIYE